MSDSLKLMNLAVTSFLARGDFDLCKQFRPRSTTALDPDQSDRMSVMIWIQTV